jgi:hypothetical protein
LASLFPVSRFNLTWRPCGMDWPAIMFSDHKGSKKKIPSVRTTATGSKSQTCILFALCLLSSCTEHKNNNEHLDLFCCDHLQSLIYKMGDGTGCEGIQNVGS